MLWQKNISDDANVLITGRKENELVNAVNNLGAKADYMVFNNSKSECLETLIVICLSKLRRIDSLVLNAGVSLHEGNFLNVTQEGFNVQFV